MYESIYDKMEKIAERYEQAISTFSEYCELIRNALIHEENPKVITRLEAALLETDDKIRRARQSRAVFVTEEVLV